MRRTLLEVLACPHCGKPPRLAGPPAGDEDIIEATLHCDPCNRAYEVRDGIPRFVGPSNYADSFGFQWNAFRETQLDSYSRVPISRERLFRATAWDASALKGARVLDIGCGAGRFAEVALEAGAQVVGVDYSRAVDAARRNLVRYPGFEGVQASVFELPFLPESFDYIYCLGVLQHTPDPDKAFACVPRHLKRGGALAVDVYPFLWANIFWSKYWLRPFTKRVPSEKLFAIVQRAVPGLLRVSRLVASIPVLGRKLKYLIPVVNYEGAYGLSEAQLREWAVLDTFDMLAPEHDHPKSERTVKAWFTKAGLVDIEVFRHGHVIGRGRKAP